jgi:hypothetical protein
LCIAVLLNLHDEARLPIPAIIPLFIECAAIRAALPHQIVNIIAGASALQQSLPFRSCDKKNPMALGNA